MKSLLSGSFGVLFSGKLVAHLYDDHGAAAGTRVLGRGGPPQHRYFAREDKRCGAHRAEFRSI